MAKASARATIPGLPPARAAGRLVHTDRFRPSPTDCHKFILLNGSPPAIQQT